MTLKQTLCTIILCLFVNKIYAQDVNELQLLSKKFSSAKKQKTDYEIARENRNEAQLIFSGLFLFYKNFLSSQDSQKCTFHPSCSEYGILAVKQFGAIKGMALTFDRLTRCNGLSPTKYKIDFERKLLLDPVSNE